MLPGHDENLLAVAREALHCSALRRQRAGERGVGRARRAVQGKYARCRVVDGDLAKTAARKVGGIHRGGGRADFHAHGIGADPGLARECRVGAEHGVPEGFNRCCVLRRRILEEGRLCVQVGGALPCGGVARLQCREAPPCGCVVHRRDVGAFEHRKQQAQVRRFDDEVVGEECQARGAVHVHVEMRAAGPARRGAAVPGEDGDARAAGELCEVVVGEVERGRARRELLAGGGGAARKRWQADAGCRSGAARRRRAVRRARGRGGVVSGADGAGRARSAGGVGSVVCRAGYARAVAEVGARRVGNVLVQGAGLRGEAVAGAVVGVGAGEAGGGIGGVVEEVGGAVAGGGGGVGGAVRWAGGGWGAAAGADVERGAGEAGGGGGVEVGAGGAGAGGWVRRRGRV